MEINDNVDVQNEDICRLYKQIIQTILDTNAETNDIIQPYNLRNVGKTVCPTLTTRPEGLKTAIFITDNTGDTPAARRLTPRECYRLMGIDDEDIDRLLKTDLGDSRHWKLAGNSIVVDCMYHMFYNLFIERPEKKEISLW